MYQPGSWSEITEGSTPTVPVFRELRHAPGTAHVYASDGQYLAVQGAEPYGGLESLPDDVAEHVHLMTPSSRGEGLALFHVPEELIALEGLTFGTGRKRTELLRPLYQRIGRALTNLAQLSGAHPALLGVDDFAYDRQSDKLVLLPPVHFGEYPHTVEDYRSHFVQSMAEHFGHFWLPETMRSMTADAVGRDVQ